MDTENEINLQDLDNAQEEANNKLQIKDRFAKLSEKMTLSAKEKEAAEAKAFAEADRATKAEKERDFFRDFSKLSSQYPEATNYQDKILEKVNTGYTPEDATLAILAKEGKLGGSVKPITTPSPAGGSASTSITDTDKSPEEMSQDERRKALFDLEKGGTNLLKL